MAEQTEAELNAIYAANGWPSVDHRSPDYCYQPCRTGLHVCGVHPDGENAMTVLNLPTRTADEARGLFERARIEVGEARGQKADYVVDLMINRDCDEDFGMNRQMLERLKALAA